MKFKPLRNDNVPYIEFTGPPGCGKTTAALRMLLENSTLAPGRRSLCRPGIAQQVNRLGLPREGVRMWLRLLRQLPSAVTTTIQFWRDTKHLRSAWTLLSLLIKSHAQSMSPRLWVVDQGLQQHILSTLARGHLTPQKARVWKLRCQMAPWRPETLISMTTNREELLRRVKTSKKHMSQCQPGAPEDYVDAYLRCSKVLEDQETPIYSAPRSGMEMSGRHG